jgi:sulfoquinovosyltransferase
MKIFRVAMTSLAVMGGAINAFVPEVRTTISSSSTCSNSPLFMESPMTFSSDSSNAPPLKRNPPRKVCLMVEPTPFTHVSGYSNRFKEMLRYLRKAGDEVEILTTDGKTPEKDLPKESFGYPIEHTQGFTFPLYKHITLSFDLPEMKGLRILEKLKPDLIHCASPGFMVFPAILYARVLRIPLLMSYHTHIPAYSRNYMTWLPYGEEFSWFCIRSAHKRADLTLCTSPQMKEELSANGIPRVDVWRKGIDTVRFDPKFRSDEMRKKMTDGNPDDFLMVYVGRLGHEKGLKRLKPVLESMPNARLCLVGGGPQAEELHKFFEGTNTVFTGQISGDELSSAFASADAFVMPSESETLGFVVLESMASGVPVVGANAGGIPDLIKDGVDGFLVEPTDTEAYVDRLEKLRDTKFRAEMGNKARKEAERWSWEAATSVLRNVQYERAMINFHNRAFGGFGKPGSESMWRLLKWRIRRVMWRLRVPGFRNKPQEQL